MANVKYIFNPETVSYDKVEVGVKVRLVNLLKYLATTIIMSVVILVGVFYFFDSPKEKNLIYENQQMLSRYIVMSRELEQMKSVLSDLEQRDDNIYRVIFEAEPIPSSVRKAGFGGVNRYKDLENLNSADLVISTAKKLDNLAKEMYIQSKSYDEVEVLVKNKCLMLASIPAVMPVAIKDFGRISAGYGWRIHPIYKTRKYHRGMDFTGIIGTPIYATGDGVVKQAISEKGYGKKIVIDHGYGYKTLYAHLDKYCVKRGQKVKRGEMIGFLGNSGVSTGPHLHYEVHKNNMLVNPINYYFNDLTASEYDRMVKIAANTGQTMD